jgi:Glyoxalase superfamily protein/Clp amino terminal domain, pathogenicity island component
VNVSQSCTSLCPNERASNASSWRTCFVQAKDEDMRDFRDAKAMAHTLRVALAAKDHKITISQSLELIAGAFGVADWNTLSAAIHARTTAPTLAYSPAIEATCRQALAFAVERKQEIATLEHLLLALTDDPDASAVMNGCKADLGAIKQNLINYIDNEMNQRFDWKGDAKECTPSVAFQRVTKHRAALTAVRMQGWPAFIVTGAHVLLSIFPESQSPAAKSLVAQAMTIADAENFIRHGAVKGDEDAAS